MPLLPWQSSAGMHRRGRRPQNSGWRRPGPLAGCPSPSKTSFASRALTQPPLAHLANFRALILPHPPDAWKCRGVMVGKVNLDEFTTAPQTNRPPSSQPAHPWDLSRVQALLGRQRSFRSSRRMRLSWYGYGRLHPPAGRLLRRVGVKPTYGGSRATG